MEYNCPNCKKDLRKVGFYSRESVITQYRWKWNEEHKWFESGKGEIKDSVDSVGVHFCNDCDVETTDISKELIH